MLEWEGNPHLFVIKCIILFFKPWVFVDLRVHGLYTTYLPEIYLRGLPISNPRQPTSVARSAYQTSKTAREPRGRVLWEQSKVLHWQTRTAHLSQKWTRPSCIPELLAVLFVLLAGRSLRWYR